MKKKALKVRKGGSTVVEKPKDAPVETKSKDTKKVKNNAA